MRTTAKTTTSSSSSEAWTSAKSTATSTAKKASGSPGAGSGADSSSPSGGNSNSASSGSNQQQASTPQKKWVAEQGHWETTYEQVWVSKLVETRHERAICATCGATFDSFSAYFAHSDEMDEQGLDHDRYIDDSYSTYEDQGHYENQATGQKWVVDVAGHWE